MPFSALCAAPATVVLAASLVGAQERPEQERPAPRFEIEPTVGVFLPLADQVDVRSALAPGGGAGGTTLGRATSRQQPGAVLGLGVRWRASPAFGVTLWLAQANSTVEDRVAIDGSGSRSARVGARVLAGALLAEVSRPTGRANLTWNVGAGPAQIYRAGDAYQEVTEVRDFGAAFQAGIRYAIRPRLGFRLTARDLVYRTSFGTGAAATPGRTQNDVSVLAGLGIGL